MTRENLFLENDIRHNSPIYGHVTKLFLESEVQYKGNKQMKKKKNANLQQNFAVFSAATDSDNKVIQILYRKSSDK